ncbi:MAG TPA: Mbeg1-like protein [Burkholderiales bacterium]|nr:Mbeg1-like protein [Burkholderiales bacterium]
MVAGAKASAAKAERGARKAAAWAQDQAAAAKAWASGMTQRAVSTAKNVGDTAHALGVALIGTARLFEELPLGTGCLQCKLAALLRPQMTGEQAREALPYAKLATAAYGGDDGLPPGWKPVDPKSVKGLEKAIFNDSTTNFGARLFESPDGRMALAFKGTDPTSMADLEADAHQGFGGVPVQYQQADELAANVAAVYGAENVQLVGHSLGGGLASYAGLRNGLAVKSFNGAGLSTGARANIGPELYARNSGNITNYNAIGDLVSDPAPLVAPGTPLGLDAEQPGTKLFFDSPGRGPVTKHMMSTGVLPGLEAAGAAP